MLNDRRSLFINNNDLCLMSAAKPSRNNPFPLPGSAEQLPFPWPSFTAAELGHTNNGRAPAAGPARMTVVPSLKPGGMGP